MYALRPLQSSPFTGRLTARIISFIIPETLPAFVYSATTIFLAYGAVRLLYSFPGAAQVPFSAPLDPVMTLCARACGWGLVLAALVAVLLRDTVDKPKPLALPALQGEAFRMLNLGLAGFMLLSAAVLALGAHGGVVAVGKPFWLAVGVLGTIGAWSGYHSRGHVGPEQPAQPASVFTSEQ